jgi:GTP pyrophosphokinase
MFGVGALNNKHIRSYVNTKNQGWYGLLKRKIYNKESSTTTEKVKSPINKPTVIFGDDQQVLDYKLAKCCSSIQGDEIFGFTTINDGIKVHNVNCPNAIQLQSRYAYRIIPAKWATVENLEYSSVLRISGYDQIGLVSKITKLISNEMNVNISSINIVSNDGVFDGRISVLVINKVHLENLINKLENIEGVESVVRL